METRTTHVGAVPQVDRTGAPRLVIVRSATASSIGVVHSLDRDETIIGRAEDAPLRIDDPSVSRQHAKILRKGPNTFQLVDLGSKNGTYLNGVKVDQATLSEGDRIAIGNSTIVRFGTGDLEHSTIASAELQRQAQVFESFHDAVAILDPNGRLVDWNPAAERLFGFGRADIMGRSMFDVLRPGEPDALTSFVLMQASTRGLWGSELTWKRSDGTSCPCEVVVTPLRDADNKTVGFVSVHRDLSERRQLQAQLQVADRLASLGTLAAGVAHEVNNPLSFIRANLTHIGTELSDSPLPSPQKEEVDAAIRECLDGVARIASIVRDLKSFARGDGGDAPAASDLKATISLALKMADNVIRHRAKLVVEVPDGLPMVTGHVGRLAQVFLNLLINAAHALPENRAEENTIKVRAFVDGGFVMTEVADTGVGMSPDVLRRAFDPFFTTKPMGVGTGLGLSVCHGIVETYGGDITAESKVGTGSTFRVSLPVNREAAMSAGASLASAEKSGGPRATVLVVDDEPYITKSLQRMLGRAHDVVVFNDPVAALNHLKERPNYDLVLCDVMMPAMSGLDLLERLSRDVPAQAERFVFMTGGTFTPEAQQALEKTHRPALMKPLDRAALEEQLQRARTHRLQQSG